MDENPHLWVFIHDLGFSIPRIRNGSNRHMGSSSILWVFRPKVWIDGHMGSRFAFSSMGSRGSEMDRIHHGCLFGSSGLRNPKYVDENSRIGTDFGFLNPADPKKSPKFQKKSKKIAKIRKKIEKNREKSKKSPKNPKSRQKSKKKSQKSKKNPKKIAKNPKKNRKAFDVKFRSSFGRRWTFARKNEKIAKRPKFWKKIQKSKILKKNSKSFWSEKRFRLTAMNAFLGRPRKIGNYGTPRTTKIALGFRKDNSTTGLEPGNPFSWQLNYFNKKTRRKKCAAFARQPRQK